MAKRKKRGAAYGKQAGPKSQEAMRKRERNQIGKYGCIGLLAMVFLCSAILYSSGIFSSASDSAEDDSAETINDPIDEGFEASTDSVDDDGDETSAETDDGFTASSTSEPIESGEFELIQGTGLLDDVAPVDRNNYYSEPPAMIIDQSESYEAVFVTQRGDIRVRLYDDETPITVNNFISLSLDGFYNGLTFHRVMTDFMAQGGDPTGTGTGGPGYTFEDEIVSSLVFDRPGILAMANSGPSTNGSQFFITFEPTPWLDGAHTIFGEVIEGEDVLAAIRIRDPASDPEPGDLIERIDIYAAQ